MREIKFRAWDKNNKRWVYGFLNGPYFDCSLNPNGIDGKEDGTELQVLNLDDWLQYTGLKDKNGKEIYEGNFLRNNDDVKRVQFINGCFCLVNKDKGYWLDFKTAIEVMTDTDIHYDVLFDWEVIGTVYENPELLK